MVVDLCHMFAFVRHGDEKMRLLDRLTMRRVGGQAVVENSNVASKMCDLMGISPNSTYKI